MHFRRKHAKYSIMQLIGHGGTSMVDNNMDLPSPAMMRGLCCIVPQYTQRCHMQGVGAKHQSLLIIHITSRRAFFRAKHAFIYQR